jgi:HEAT repeats
VTRAFSRVSISLATLVLVGVALAAQQPRISNANLKPQPAGAAFAQSFRSLVSAQVEPAWIGYSVPAVEGERVMCCFASGDTWISGDIVMSDRGSHTMAGCCLEPGSDSRRPVSGSQSNVPIKLEGSDRLVVLVRAVDRRVERVRLFSEDCPLDAGGRDVHWIEDVRPADSIALLESIAVSGSDHRRMSEGAVAAIAMHGDPAADAALERLIAPAQPASLRKKVTFWLGNARNRAGLDLLKRVLRDDASLEVRKGAVFGVSQSREPDAVDFLIATARSHAEREIRGEAIFWLGQKAGAKAASAITERIEQDPDTEVKKRAVFALSQLPKDEGVPLLIKVARTNPNPAVKKQAMFWLGQSKDARAVDFFAEVLK